jgi:hypothetical protein
LTDEQKKTVGIFDRHLKEGCVSAQAVDDIRKGLVSGSNVQQVRNEIEQPKKQKEK